MEPEKVIVESMSYGPAAVARSGGCVLFVDSAAPGDVALVRRISGRKRYADAEIVELLDPSPARVTPPCPHFTECGGCQWMHLGHRAQLAWKRNAFLQSLRRIGRVEPEECSVAEGPALGYRWRSRMSARRWDGRNRVGFNAYRSHRFVPIEACLQMAEPLSRALAVTGAALAALPEEPSLHQIELTASPITGEWFCLLHARARHKGKVDALLSALKGAPGLLWAGWAPERTEQRLCYEVAGLRLGFGPYSFIQGNAIANERLVQEAVSMLGDSPGVVCDLYCGIGNFTLPLAAKAGEVVGVESNPLAVADAESNAQALGAANVRFVRDDAGTAAERFASEGERFDAVVLDPPRVGCSEVIGPLCRLRPERIIYVSCEPPTFARDAGGLVRGGYKLRRSIVVDMFPQTFRIESASLFTLEAR